tara:strand:+ start:112 stop:1806 length:1695 start_codon:yes stop_codon:yes gene_type:complete
MDNFSPKNDDDINFSSIFSSINRNKKSFFIIAFSLAILSGIYAFKKKPTWEGTFQIVLRQNQEANSISSLLANTRSPISLLRNRSSQQKLNTEILIIQSPSVLKPIYDYVKSEYDSLGYDTSSFRFRKWKKNLLVKLEKKSNVLAISYRDNQQKLIIPVLNKISEKYQEYSGRDRLNSLKKAEDYLNQQVSIYIDKSRESSGQLQAYAKLHNIGLLDVEANRTSDDTSKKKRKIGSNALMLDLESKFISAKNDLELTNKKLEQLKNIDKEANLDQQIAMYSMLDNSDSKNVDLLSRISEIDKELVRYETGFKNKNPKVKNLKLLKEETFKLLKESVTGSLKGQREKAIAVQNASKRPEEVIVKYKELYRQAKLDLETLSNLEFEKNINSLSLAKKNNPWQLISNPLLFDKPVLPNKPRIVFTGIFFGIIFGTLFAKYQDKKSGLIYEKNDIDNLLNYKNLFDFSNIDEDKLDEVIDIFIEKYIIKENLIVFTLGDFSNKISNKVLKLIKENKKKPQILDNLKDIEDSSKVLILISLNNLSKSQIVYVNNLFKLKRQSELFTAYI